MKAELLRFDGAVERAPAIDAWMKERELVEKTAGAVVEDIEIFQAQPRVGPRRQLVSR